MFRNGFQFFCVLKRALMNHDLLIISLHAPEGAKNASKFESDFLVKQSCRSPLLASRSSV